MFPTDLAATCSAATDPHSVLGHPGSGQGRQPGDVGEIYPLFLQLVTTLGTEFQGHPHIHWRFGDFLGMWRLAEREGALPGLAVGTLGLLGAGPLGKECGLASGTPLELLNFSQQRLVVSS